MAYDEVVMMRILQVLLDLMRCPVGDLMTDVAVWETFVACYSIGRQPRLTVLLRRTAETIQMQMTLTVFARLREGQMRKAAPQPVFDSPAPAVASPNPAGTSTEEAEAAAAAAKEAQLKRAHSLLVTDDLFVQPSFLRSASAGTTTSSGSATGAAAEGGATHENDMESLAKAIEDGTLWPATVRTAPP